MKSSTIKVGLLVLGLTAFVSNSSFGQEGKQDRKKPTYSELLKKMDANEDGKLAKAEVKGRLEENFDKIDTDKDGFISEKEFENAPKPERKGKRKQN
ncbi:CREC-EF hand family protein [Aureibaculum luteum]|uniref:EF-hand domain-containing protein n=1 Tax=Aureibaculum luteum TaxID=1548456 RepID=UPI000E46C1CF|nr:EF-hand domain-containing protein [Aureibaculum luteum]